MIILPSQFPASDYTPFGYLDNPAHSAVFHRSGAVRSVPPLGFGFFARSMPWSYGDGLERTPGYLSLLYLSLEVDGARFHATEDFLRNAVSLVSRYHTKNLMSYDWQYAGLGFSARYFLPDENSLVCIFSVENRSEQEKNINLYATNIYGGPGHKYWGRDGVLAQYSRQEEAAISKVWAYGDVFAMGADRPSQAHNASANRREWLAWMYGQGEKGREKAVVNFRTGTDHTYNTLRYSLRLPGSASDALVFCLARGTNEGCAVDHFRKALANAVQDEERLLKEDAHFYAGAPRLTGDWPETWKHGWIYDLETARMTIRPPLGIFRHPWDGMQIYTPRSVLGEMSMDTLLLSYADSELAKEVIYGTFADAPAANVPCTREDGSMNMISESGSEDGTGPNWGLPFLTIQSIYLRDHDDRWIRKLYPSLKAYLEWWLAHRTDEEGWIHADCSWESGQDGSKRFLQTSEGGSAAFVRTVDIEAAAAHAMQVMAEFARIAGAPEDVPAWESQAKLRREHVAGMYREGWFYDIDARTGEPIILPGYYDIMMLYPLTLGLATQEQIDGVRPMFLYFQEHAKPWLEWPPSIEAIVEAAWQAGERRAGAEIIASTADRVYGRTDGRRIEEPEEDSEMGLADRYAYRIPGIASEYWPVSIEPGIYRGGESYGWGATLPVHILRSLIGFREIPSADTPAFQLAPCLPEAMLVPGQKFGIANLRYRACRFDLEIEVVQGGSLALSLNCRLSSPAHIQVKDDQDTLLAESAGMASTLLFSGINGAVFTINY